MSPRRSAYLSRYSNSFTSKPLKRRIALIVFVLALLVSQLSTAASFDASAEDCFRAKTNYERRSRGIPELTRNTTVDKIARAHSTEMAMRGTIYHNPNLAEELPAFTAAGENVGEGADCPSIHAAFMSSPGHKANILDRDYTQLGVGVSRNGDTIYIVEDFLNPVPVSSTPPPKLRPRSTPGRCST